MVADDPRGSALAAAHLSPGRHRATRILVVEDNEGQRRTLRDILSSDGFEVLTCGTAGEARGLARTERDLGVVVLDLDLPDENGIHLLDQLLEIDESLRIVINTGCGSFTSAKRAVNSGAFAYVEKAGDPEELLLHVHRALRFELDRYAEALETEVDEHSAQLHAANETLQEQALERERLEGRLRQAQKLEAVGTLASGIAHDFNNLLTVIKGYTELAAATVRDESVQQDLGGVSDAVDQATELTRSLLVFAGGMGEQRTPIRVDRLLDLALRMLRRLLPASIAIVEQVEDPELWVEGNQTQLQQILLNLALNAVDAMEGTGTIEFGSRRCSGGRLELTVRDEGTGIAAEVLERVFDPFFTTKAKGQGTGLGLSMVHGIVAQHGGEVRIESRVGEGTRVTVTLPTCKPVLANSSARTGRHDRQPGEGTILMAEDNPMVFRLIRNALVDAGYRVLEATAGDEALALYERHGPEIDLVLFDVDLPGERGPECARRIRTADAELPVVLISGRPLEPSDQVDDVVFLPKPFGTRRLLDAVGDLLASRRSI